jgi:hypothetical protein
MLTITGCIEVTFPEPMPQHRRDLSQFPKSWRGTWTSQVKGEGDAGEDEIMVILDQSIVSNGDTLTLGNEVVLHRMGCRLVLNLAEEKGTRWTVMVAERSGDQLNVRSFDAAQTGAIARWESIIGSDHVVKIHRDDDPNEKLKEIQLNPKSNRQFKKLVEGGASELVMYQRLKNQPSPAE